MSDTEPRCPKCCSKLTWLTRGPTSEDCTLENDWQLICSNVECGKHVIFLVTADTEADCIRQATNMKLLDRLVREAVEAELGVIVASFRRRLANCLMCGSAAECSECCVLKRVLTAIEDRKDASRRQHVDNSKGT